MTYKFSYEKMRMWSDVRMYIKSVYEITNTFPLNEKFGLFEHLNRMYIMRFMYFSSLIFMVFTW